MNYWFLGSGSILCWLQILYDTIRKVWPIDVRLVNISQEGWKDTGSFQSAKCHFKGMYLICVILGDFIKKPRKPFCLLLNCEWVDFDIRFVRFAACVPVSATVPCETEVPTTFTMPSSATKGPLIGEHQLVDATTSHILCEGYEPSQLMIFCESFRFLLEFDLVGTAYVCPNNGCLLCCFEKVGRSLQGTNPGVSFLDRLLVSWLVD